MRKRRLAAMIGLVLALAVAALTQLDAQTIQRSLRVSVVDSAGRVVPKLGPADFIVREDRVAREVLRVAPATDPMQIALLVDDSQAASGFLTDYREAFKAFVSTIGGDADVVGKHSVAIVTVAARPTIRANFTSDQDELQKAAGRIFTQTDSATCLLDGIFEISEGFVKRESQRPVIVAVTSEGPEVSNRSYLHVLDMLRKSGAALYVITVGARLNPEIERNHVIYGGARDSGGVYDNLLTSRALPTRLKDLASEITHQYLVTYAHPDSLIPPEQVTVSAANPDLTARGTIVRDEIEVRRR